MKINKQWFSILIWMGIMILIILTAYVILSFIIPFSKNIKWIDNSSNAYYQSNAWIEKALMHTKTRLSTPWQSLITESWAIVWTSVWYVFNTFSSWNTIPVDWYGNSEYSTWYNIISQTEPIQLQIWRKYHSITNLWNQNINFTFKVPNLDNNLSTIESFSWGLNYPVINWILSSENDTLYASWSYVKGNNIANSNTTNSNWNITDKEWLTLWWASATFRIFYQNNCSWTNSWCILKMGVLNDLFLTTGTKLPYLEYKITFPWNIADRYTRVESYGKSYGFQKKLDVRVPQQTINQAFDFTVFQ